MRFSNIVLAYFVMGAMMWAGGAIAWGDAGVGQLFIEDPGSDVQINKDTSEKLDNAGGPIQEAADSVGGGGLIATLGILLDFVGFLFWPITVLLLVGAPLPVVVLLGGTPTVAFFTTLLRLVRQSA